MDFHKQIMTGGHSSVHVMSILSQLDRFSITVEDTYGKENMCIPKITMNIVVENSTALRESTFYLNAKFVVNLN